LTTRGGCATTCLLFNGLPKTKATIITTPTKPNSIVKVYFIKSIESDNRRITDKINKNIKGVKFKTNITKDGWSANVIDKKDKIQIKIGE
jgi:hypothetical protein